MLEVVKGSASSFPIIMPLRRSPDSTQQTCATHPPSLPQTQTTLTRCTHSTMTYIQYRVVYLYDEPSHALGGTITRQRRHHKTKKKRPRRSRSPHGQHPLTSSITTSHDRASVWDGRGRHGHFRALVVARRPGLLPAAAGRWWDSGSHDDCALQAFTGPRLSWHHYVRLCL